MILVCNWQLGCVHRRLTIRSNPPGALVYVDNQEIGRTPVSTSFVYYGTRAIRLEMDGYEPVEELHRLRPPWYQYPPIDFVSENFSFREIRDERVLDFELVPMQLVPTQQLIQRANQLRRDSQMGFVAPLPTLPAAAPVIPGPPLPGPLSVPGPIGPPGSPPLLPPQSSQFVPPQERPYPLPPLGTIDTMPRGGAFQAGLPSFQHPANP